MWTKEVQQDTIRDMKDYGQYVSELKSLLCREVSEVHEDIARALDGEAYSSLRSLMPIQVLRSSGAFFTSHDTAEVLVERARKFISAERRILDPACGAGNLLVAAAKHLPLRRTFRATLNAWGKIIYGYDLHPEFIEATKLRLALLAKQRGKFSVIALDPKEIFPNIRCLDALSDEASSVYSTVSVLLLNPPYQAITAPDSCEWTRGNVSAAAVFLDHLSYRLNRNARIYALLPEVLRCGSRYSTFRNNLSKRAKSIYQQSRGIFDKWTDIDVFITEMHLIEDNDNTDDILFSDTVPAGEVVGDRFDIRVGPVVDFRSPEKGDLRPYYDVDVTVPWSTACRSNKRRKFNGTVFIPPLVVIRRNSRPDYQPRAIGTIIRGSESVAVENHLIVAIPRRSTVKECELLMDVLRNSRTDEYLNQVMRCRHLTVGAVKGIPWNEKH